MTDEQLADSLRDVASGILTPFSEDRRDVLHDEVKRNAQYLYDRGMRLFLSPANVSEYHSLTPDERIGTVESVVDTLPADATVLAGAGGSTETVLDLAGAYAAAGAHGLMIMPPDHAFRHERGLLAYYERIGERAELPLIPYFRGIEVSADTVAAVAELERVAGIKYALHDVVKFVRAIEAAEGDTVWINGMAEPYAPTLYAEGAEGFSSGVGNFEPSVSLSLMRVLRAGDWDRARTIRNATLPFQSLRSEPGSDNALPAANSVPALKTGLEMAGLYGGPVREPLVELSESDERRARKLYGDIEAFVESELEPSPRATIADERTA